MRVIAIIKRIRIQMLRDKRALALMMVAPLLVLTLMHYLLASETPTPRLGIYQANDKMIEQIEKFDIIVIPYSDIENTHDIILEDDLDGFLSLDKDQVEIILTNDQTSSSKALQMKIQQALAQPVQQSPMNIKTSYLYGNEDTIYFDQLSPILMGFFVFFFVFLISGIALLRERTTGTLDRLLSTPIKRTDIVFGYVIGYGLFAIIQTIIIVLYATMVLDITLVGSVWNVFLINLTLALVALSLGILLSAFANSEFQMMQFIPIAIIPQIFFAGIFPVDGMAEWLQPIAKIMPMYYGGNALVNIMYKGLGFTDILTDVAVLFGFALVFITLNIFVLKKYRKI